jgi:pyruvate dehydrogenase E2 component (dihydrolipoamide acetyltransferase)
MTSLQAVTIPKWGLSMEEGTIVSWSAKVGQAVTAGDELVDVETTKITNTIEAQGEGVLRRILADAGDTLPCGRLIAVIGAEDATDGEIDEFVAAYATSEAETGGDSGGKPEPATLDLDGTRIRYFRAGDSGTPIVLIHGFGGDLDNWLFVQGELADNQETIAFDLPGHGGSTKTVGDGTPRALAEVIGRALDALGVARAHVVGHSFGASVAASLATLDPARFVSVTAIAPAGLGPEINGEYIQGFLNAKRRSDLTKAVSLLFADPSVVTSNMVEQLLRAKRLDGAQAALQTIVAANFPGDEQTPQQPDPWPSLADKLLVIWGERDAIIPPTHVNRLPASTDRVTIEGAGHMPHLERPGDVAAAIRDHIAAAE